MTDEADVKLAPIIDIATKRAEYCGHRCLRHVCQERREVTCSKCGAVLDAFDALYDVAREHESRVYRSKRLEEEIKERGARLEAIVRQLENAKARLKRAKIREQNGREEEERT